MPKTRTIRKDVSFDDLEAAAATGDIDAINRAIDTGLQAPRVQIEKEKEYTMIGSDGTPFTFWAYPSDMEDLDSETPNPTTEN